MRRKQGEDSSLAASAGTGKGRLIDNVLQIYSNHLVKRLPVDGRCAEFSNTFDKRHWAITLEEDQRRCNRRLTSLSKQKAR
jgi:hypothetical protein